MTRFRLAGSLCVLAVASVAAAKLGYVERLRDRVWRPSPRLSAGDFPAGVAAPVDDVASVPLRPTLIGVVGRGSIAPLWWAGRPDGLFRQSYALDVRVVPFESEAALRQALVKGGD